MGIERYTQARNVIHHCDPFGTEHVISNASLTGIEPDARNGFKRAKIGGIAKFTHGKSYYSNIDNNRQYVADQYARGVSFAIANAGTDALDWDALGWIVVPTKIEERLNASGQTQTFKSFRAYLLCRGNKLSTHGLRTLSYQVGIQEAHNYWDNENKNYWRNENIGDITPRGIITGEGHWAVYPIEPEIYDRQTTGSYDSIDTYFDREPLEGEDFHPDLWIKELETEYYNQATKEHHYQPTEEEERTKKKITHIHLVSPFSNFGISNDFWDWWEFESDIPIYYYDNYEGIIKYFEYADDSESENNLDLDDIDLSTDWVVHLTSPNPSISVTWKSNGLDEYLKSEQAKKRGFTQASITASFYTVLAENNAIIPIKTTKYGGNFSTTYGELADNIFPDLWSKWLLNIEQYIDQGQLDGVGDLPLYFKLVVGTRESCQCVCRIPFSKSPTRYGKEPIDVKLDDNSTVTIDYNYNKWRDVLPDDDDKDKKDDDDKWHNPEPYPNDHNGAFNTIYKISDGTCNGIATWLWTDGTKDDFHINYTGDNEIVKGIVTIVERICNAFLRTVTYITDEYNMVNSNPIENLVSLKRFPVDVNGGSSRAIKFGNLNSGFSGNVCASNQTVTIGEIKIPSYYNGSFLDIAFTKITIFLPFVGFKELDMRLYMDRTLKVNYVFDLYCGTIKAMLYADGLYVQSFEGNGAIDIPVTASNRANVEAGLIGSIGHTVGSFVSGNGLSSLSDVATFNMTGNQYHYSTVGSYSSNTGWKEPRECYIVIDRPNVQYPSNYGHTIGYPCMLTKTIGSCSGLIITEPTVDLSNIPCTLAEREKIKNYLSSGIYV